MVETQRSEDLAATLERMQRQQTATSSLSVSDAFVAGDVEQLAREITETAAKATGVERANVWLFNDDESQLRCIDLFEATPGRHSSGAVLERSEYGPEFAALKGVRFVDAHDAQDDPRTAGYVEGYLKPLGITSMLDALIAVSGHHLGVLCLEHVNTPHHWERDEVDFACQLADKIALSMVNRARREAQDTLRASEVRYRRLFESAKDGILILDAETAVIVDVNPFLCELMGFSREDVLGRKVWELGYFKDLLANEAHFFELRQRGYVRYDDMALQASDGRRIDVEFVSNVYLVAREKVIQCNIRDITERKRVEAALKASESKYHGLFEATRDAILTLGPPDWTFSSGNPAAVRMFGARDVADLVSHKPWETSPVAQSDGRASSEKAAEMIATAMREGSHSFEWTHRRIDGVEFAAHVLLTRVEQGGESILHATVRDITESKAAAEALEASLREKQALLKEVHHRVKNNLQVITSLLRLEAARRSDEGTRLVLREMQGRILSMALLHETLYRSGDFGRVELSSYLQQLSQQLFRAQAATGVVALVLDLSPVRVEIDQAIPCGLIVNELLTNSLKHGFVEGRSGEVRVSIRPEGETSVRLEVSDTGVGVPVDFEARLLKSLGMQLITDLARQLGGRLDVGARPGATFTVTFNRTAEHSTAGFQRSRPRPWTDPAKPS